MKVDFSINNLSKLPVLPTIFVIALVIFGVLIMRGAVQQQQAS